MTCRPILLPTLLLAASLWSGAAQTQPQAPEPTAERAVRPRIGLVLSGGGARGLTHVGVLKVLEQNRIPIDMIAGTSMGAIIGGLYASGMTATEIERELARVDWDRLFANRVGRQELSQRRKEEDFDLATAIELGYRDGEFRAPQSAVSSRGLETLLRRYTLPVRLVEDFDKLPIPFRAVATDMETGAAVHLDSGDLAIALRSSMSVPGVFPSTEVDGRVLGDGGLVDNVPVGLARTMGADIVIVVNIGTPLAGRETLNSAIGLTAQMISILTEQNVRRSLDTLTTADLLITPDLGTLSSGDFARTREFIQIGEASAQAMADRLLALSMSDTDYTRWRTARRATEPPGSTIAFVAYEGTTRTNPPRLEPQLLSKPGQPFEPAKAAADARYLAASGDYVRTDYRLMHTDQGDGLVFDLEDKPWGPNYLNIGLDLSTDLSGHSAFNIKIRHNRHWLTPNGTEWRNGFQIGEVPKAFTEIYHPLKWTLGLSNDWFAAAYARVEERNQTLFLDNGAIEVGQLNRTTRGIGVDLGQPWGSLGEIRIGLLHQGGSDDQVYLSNGGLARDNNWSETAGRLRVVVDQLDYANFPQHGYRFETEAQLGRARYDGNERLVRLTGQGSVSATYGRQTVNLQLMAKAASALSNTAVGQFSLGGFQQLSGYRDNQITGNALLFGRIGWYMRLADTPVFARGFFMGASLEAGDAWIRRQDMRLTGLRTGGSVYLGADTGIGPMYFGITWAPRGEAGLALFIGRP